jgi:hypothetical protein
MEVWSGDGEFLGAMRLLGDRWPDMRTLAVSGTHVLARYVLESGLHQVWAFPIPLGLRAAGSGER